MRRILIVEDDSFKRDDLAALVSANIGMATIHTATDVRSAIVEISRFTFDLVIIDMALPSHPAVSGGGSPMSLLTGGLEILFELSALDRKDDCIIVTQYPEIEISGRFFPVTDATDAIREKFQIDVIACIEYSAESVAWRGILAKLLMRYENTNT